MPEIKKYYRLNISMVTGETERWDDCELEWAREKIIQLAEGKSIVTKDGDYFLNANYVVTARVGEYVPYVAPKREYYDD